MSGAEDNIPTRQEVEQILGDERIPWDTRRDLALQYLDYVEDEDPTKYGFVDEADRNGFRDHCKEMMKISEGDLNWNQSFGAADVTGIFADSLAEDVSQAYTNAKNEYDKLQDGDRKAERNAVNGGQAALDGITARSSATDAGAANSNEILDTGIPGLRVFDNFLPLYQRALAVVGGGSAPSLGELVRLYDEQRDIPFSRFAAGAEEFGAVQQAMATSSSQVSTRLGSTFANWEGAASDKAKQHHQAYAKKTEEVAKSVGDAANAVRECAGSVGKFCREKSNWMLHYYFDRIPGTDIGPGDLERIIRLVEVGIASPDNDFKHCAKFLQDDVRQRLEDESCALDDDTKNFIVEQARNWLGGTFVPWFGKHVENFRQLCSNTRTAVDQAWGALTEFLGGLPENPYADLATEAPPERTESPSGGQRPTSVPGGGGPPPASAPPPGPPPGPAPPSPPAPPETAPEAAKPQPGTNPVTGGELELDPETGEPLPIDPETGEAVRDDAGAESPLTIREGDREIAVTRPGPDGAMRLTVDDGSGTPKEYDLGFPAEQDQPGGEGKVTIEDGPLTITAERPEGPRGPTVLTVDDGTGEPATYTLGETSPDTTGQTTTPQAVSGFDAVTAGIGQGQEPMHGDVAGGPTGPATGVEAGILPGSRPTQHGGAGLGTAPGGLEPEHASTDRDTMAPQGGSATPGPRAEQAPDHSAERANASIFDVGATSSRLSGRLDAGEDETTGGPGGVGSGIG